MARPVAAPHCSTCAGVFIGAVLLIFAGALFAGSPVVNESNDTYQEVHQEDHFLTDLDHQEFLTSRRLMGLNLTDGSDLTSGLLEGRSGLKVEIGYGHIVGGILHFFIVLCAGCIYKGKVVDAMGFMPEEPPHWHRGYDDFQYGPFDCIKEPHMGCLVLCCPALRTAHTNHIANICGFWPSLLCFYFSLCTIVGPGCVQFYWRYQLREHMGINNSYVKDVLLVCICGLCCLPCIEGQQGLSADDAMGFKYECPCNALNLGYDNPETLQAAE